MNLVKWILGLAVALIVVVGIAGYVIVSQTDLEDLRALVQDQAREATGRELTLAGPMDLGISLTPTVKVEQVSFANAPWGSRPEMATLDRFEIQLSLLPLISGDVQIDRIVLVGADILLEKDKDGNVNWSFEGGEDAAGETTGEAATDEGGGMPRIGAIAIESSRVVYSDPTTGQAIELGIEKLDVSPAGDNLALDLKATYQGVAIALAGEVGGPAAVASADPYPIMLKGQVAGAEITLDGTVANLSAAPAPDLMFSVAGQDVAAFAPLTGAELPAMGPYSLAGRLTGTATAVSIAGLAVKMGGSDLAGDVSVDTSGARPRIVATIASTTLALADFGAKADDEGAEAAASTSAESASDSPYVIPETPLPLGLLKSLDAEVKATIARFVASPGVEAADVAATLRLDAGVLNLDPIQATYGGGVATAALSLNTAEGTPKFALVAKVDDIDYGLLMKEQGVSDDVKGTLDIALDVMGQGDSPHAIAATLDGASELIAEKGVINNKVLALIASGLADALGPLMGGKDAVALNCVLSRFDYAGGVATSRAMLVDTETFSVAGSGTIDLRDERLDLHVDTTSRVAAIASLAVPLNVTGTLKNPSVAPDPLGTAAAAASLVGSGVNPTAALGAFLASGSSGSGGAADCVQAEQKAAEGGGGLELPGTDGASEAIDSAIESVTEGAADTGDAAGKAVESVTEGLGGLLGD